MTFAPILVGSATTAGLSSSSSSITIGVPAGPLRAGDVLIAAIRTSGATSVNDFSAPGWERVGWSFVPQSASHRAFGFYLHVVTDPASEPGGYTFTKTESDSRMAGMMVAVRGVDTTSPITGFSSWAHFDSGSATMRVGAFSTDSQPSLLLAAFAAEVVSPNSSTPVSTAAGMSEVALATSSAGTGSTRTTLWVGHEEFTGTSIGDTDKATQFTSAASGVAWAIALRGADDDPSEGAPPPAGTGRIQLRRGTTSEWEAANPILAAGEPGFDLTTGELRIGDGVTAWSDLSAITGGGGQVIFVDDVENIPPGTPAGTVVFETG